MFDYLPSSIGIVIYRILVDACLLATKNLYVQQMLVSFSVCVLQLGDQVDGLIVVFDLEHLGMHHLWKPGTDWFNTQLCSFNICSTVASWTSVVVVLIVYIYWIIASWTNVVVVLILNLCWIVASWTSVVVVLILNLCWIIASWTSVVVVLIVNLCWIIASWTSVVVVFIVNICSTVSSLNSVVVVINCQPQSM